MLTLTKEDVREIVREETTGLATKGALQTAVASLATKEELRKAVAPLATKEELRKAVAPLATKEELRKAVAPLATASSVANLATRVDGMDRKLDRLLGTVDGFTKNLEKEEQERTAGDRILERRVEVLEQGRTA